VLLAQWQYFYYIPVIAHTASINPHRMGYNKSTNNQSLYYKDLMVSVFAVRPRIGG